MGAIFATNSCVAWLIRLCRIWLSQSHHLAQPRHRLSPSAGFMAEKPYQWSTSWEARAFAGHHRKLKSSSSRGETAGEGLESRRSAEPARRTDLARHGAEASVVRTCHRVQKRQRTASQLASRTLVYTGGIALTSSRSTQLVSTHLSTW